MIPKFDYKLNHPFKRSHTILIAIRERIFFRLIPLERAWFYVNQKEGECGHELVGRAHAHAQKTLAKVIDAYEVERDITKLLRKDSSNLAALEQLKEM